MIVFSGDIGGTHTRLQLTEFANKKLIKILDSAHYCNKDYLSFASIIDTFFKETKFNPAKLASASFGVAGPIVDGMAKLTNLPWVLSCDHVRNKLKLVKVQLINDISAIGYGLETLKPDDLYTLQLGKPIENSVKALIGAGTGLGIGFMTHDGENYSAHPSEGGHVDFAPIDEIQVDLLRYMRNKYHRVSVERVLSGQGLVNIYCYLCENKTFAAKENPNLRFLIDNTQDIDLPATLAEYAIEHKDTLAKKALDIFIRIYGAQVGNLALTTLPYGGLYIVGGIAPKILHQIKKDHFLEMFSDKGRMSKLIKNVPLLVVLNTDVGLQGATIYARKIAQT